MRVLVYPHDLDMGGSQMNAIELAASVTALGHECIVFGRPGTLCQRIDELGLEFIESPEPRRRPSLRIARLLREILAERRIDVIHAYEWPPAMEAALAAERLPEVAAVCTVMSMAVAPFIPSWMPLIVGTQQISAVEQVRGRLHVNLIEPPVDLARNRPVDPRVLERFRERWGLDERPIVACVSRLVPDLKAEGIFTAIELTTRWGDSCPFQLLIVGDGRSRSAMEAAARAGEREGRRNVVFTGELADPRSAYAVADVMLAMGGSALRSLAFARPLIVQGEQGFFDTLTPESLATFLWQGWYGVAAPRTDRVQALRGELLPLLSDDALRDRLGRFGREIVEQFSLETAARTQVTVYRDAVAARQEQKRRFGAAAASFIGFGRYFVSRRVARLRGNRRTDDFNAVAVAGTGVGTVRARKPALPTSADGPILYFAGVGWDTLAGTDRQLVTEIARDRPVIWVDTPQSILRKRGQDAPAESSPAPGVVRLQVAALGIQRPILRALANRRRANVANRYLRAHGLEPSAVIASTTAPMLSLTTRTPGVKVFYETDDSVEAGVIWGVSSRYLGIAREANLASADLVVAVTPALARHLQRTAEPSRWLPNGTELDRFRTPRTVRDQETGPVRPTAGVIGQFNARTDVEMLAAVQEAGIGLLLVGPRWFTSPADNSAFDDLVARPGVRWIDAVARDELPAYLDLMDVGLTPYRDSMFNRRSYPLKTLDYLAAGVPVVATDVAPTLGLDPRFVLVAADRAAFVGAVDDAVHREWDPAEIRESVVSDGWSSRAARMLELIEEAAVSR